MSGPAKSPRSSAEQAEATAAENPRRSSEKPRGSAEKPRVSAEKPRESAEKPRGSAEKPRESAEKSRFSVLCCRRSKDKSRSSAVIAGEFTENPTTDTNETSLSCPREDKDNYRVSAVVNSETTFGAAPHWDFSSQNLYWVNVDGGEIYRYNFNENKVFKTKIDCEDVASFIVPIDCNSDLFAIGCTHRIILLKWDGYAIRCKVYGILWCVQPESIYSNNRLTDGKCDPCGRLFAGTWRAVEHNCDPFQYRYGELYKFRSKDGEVVKKDIGMSNGLAWDIKEKKMYYIDSADYEVKQYDYDCYKGIAAYAKVIYRFPHPTSDANKDPFPHGMTIDEMGNLYVAMYNGGKIYKIDPRSSRLLLVINIPAKKITSVAFGGPEFNILFVTTAAGHEETEVEAKEEQEEAAEETIEDIDEQETRNSAQQVSNEELIAANEARTSKDKYVEISGSNGSLYKVEGLVSRGLPMQRLQI